MDYEVLPTKKKALDDLKVAAEKADAIYLAADPDREGEAICWHLAEELQAAVPKKRAKARKMHRVVFNEITKRAIDEAFKNPGRRRRARRSTPSRRAGCSTASWATR